MSRVLFWHRQLSVTILLGAATSCGRFGYDAMEAAIGGGSPGGRSGATGGAIPQSGASNGVGLSSSIPAMQRGGASNVGSTPDTALSRAGASASGGTSAVLQSGIGNGGAGAVQQGGIGNGGTGGVGTRPSGGVNAGTAAGAGSRMIGGSNSGGNGNYAGSVAIGGTLATQRGGATSSVGGVSSGGVAGARLTLTGGASGGVGTGGAAGGSAGNNEPAALSCSTALDCQKVSCCTSIRVAGDTYDRGATPPYSATVNDFYLDKYEVTVGRFRAFLAGYDVWRAGPHPSANDGIHENPTIVDSGWDAPWNSSLPSSAAVFADAQHLAYCGNRSTWTSTAGANENYPINCITWYEAFAFCIWDGGRLATEAEWQYVAGGGNENRTYPWGATPNTDPMPANYYYNHNTAFLAVGSEPSGNGRWGHSDLAGSMTEWLLDWYSLDYPITCDNCANLTANTNRVTRGGTWLTTAMSLEVGSRGFTSPDARLSFAGVRCARTAK